MSRRWLVWVLLLAVQACRGRGADEFETVNGRSGSLTEPDAAADPATGGAATDRDGATAADAGLDSWPVVEPLVQDGRRQCPATHRYPEWAGYLDPATGCQGGGIAFCWRTPPSPLVMPATVAMIDTAGTCWSFRNTPLLFPRGWREATRDDCRPPPAGVSGCETP